MQISALYKPLGDDYLLLFQKLQKTGVKSEIHGHFNMIILK